MRMTVHRVGLMICAGMLGYAELHGLEMQYPDEKTLRNAQQIGQGLLDVGFVEETDEKLRISALGQAVVSIIGEADAWFTVRNASSGITRHIYVKADDYLCVDESDDQLEIILLPILPLAIGAYADVLGEWECEITDVMSDGIDILDGIDMNMVITVRGQSGASELDVDVFQAREVFYTRFCKDGHSEDYFNSTDVINATTMWLLSGLGATEDGE